MVRQAQRCPQESRPPMGVRGRLTLITAVSHVSADVPPPTRLLAHLVDLTFRLSVDSSFYFCFSRLHKHVYFLRADREDE